jgi:hypothetical protein
VHQGTDAGRGESRRPRDLQRLDLWGSSAWRCSECAVAGGGDAGPRASGSIDRVLWEVEAALDPLPLAADVPGP